MNRLEHLLTILQEECGEVIQAAAKVNRFGPNDKWKDLPSTEERLHEEFNDVLAVINLLQKQGLNVYMDVHLMEKKQKKIMHYFSYSKARGTLSE